jgi:hypothetical protein
LASKNPRNGSWRQDEKNEDGRELEVRVLRVVENLADGQTITSRDDLAAHIEKQEDKFAMQLWLLTLEGKGLIKMTESGYILTTKGRQKLQNKT